MNLACRFAIFAWHAGCLHASVGSIVGYVYNHHDHYMHNFFNTSFFSFYLHSLFCYCFFSFSLLIFVLLYKLCESLSTGTFLPTGVYEQSVPDPFIHGCPHPSSFTWYTHGFSCCRPSQPSSMFNSFPLQVPGLALIMCGCVVVGADISVGRAAGNGAATPAIHTCHSLHLPTLWATISVPSRLQRVKCFCQSCCYWMASDVLTLRRESARHRTISRYIFWAI